MEVIGFHVGYIRKLQLGREGLHLCTNRKDVTSILKSFSFQGCKDLRYLYTFRVSCTPISLNGDMEFWGGYALNETLHKIANHEAVKLVGDKPRKYDYSFNYSYIEGLKNEEAHDFHNLEVVAPNLLKTGYDSILYKNWFEGQGFESLVTYDVSKVELIKVAKL